MLKIEMFTAFTEIEALKVTFYKLGKKPGKLSF
jgi:hypothetical protein